MSVEMIAPDESFNHKAVCKHCGIESEQEFCCAGCRVIYDAINSAGLSRYYSLADLPVGEGLKVSPSLRSFEEFDHFSVKQKLCIPGDNNTEVAFIPVSGIHCAGCVWLLESLPRVEDGIVRSKLNLSTGEVLIQFYPAKVSLSEIAQILDSFGYTPSLRSKSSSEDYSSSLLWKLGVAGFCAANTMMLAVSLFQGLFTGISPQVGEYFKWVSFIITLPAILYSAIPFYQSSFAAFRQGRFHLDQPLTLAFLSAFLLSVVNTFSGHPHVYFDSVCALIFLLLVGRYLQSSALHKARKISRATWSVIPERATLNGRNIPVDAVNYGDVLDVSPGERFPVDGIVVEGESEADISVLTGESTPVPLTVGDAVFTGCLNVSAPISVKCERTGHQSRIGKLLSEPMVDDSKYANLGEKASKYFVPTVLALSFLTFIYWIPLGFESAFNNALALLIVTCPCALGIAAPAVMGIIIGTASKKGILIRKPSALEALCEIKNLCLDKTGTITTGNFSLKESTLLLSQVDARVPFLKAILSKVSTIQKEHPLSKATRTNIEMLPFPRAKEVDLEFTSEKFYPGKGVEVHSKKLGKIRFGSPSWATSETGNHIVEPEKCSNVLLVIDNSPALILSYEDEISIDVIPAIREVDKKEIVIHILSGDSEASVTRVSEKLGVPNSRAKSRLSPEDKVDYINKLSGLSAMVGDGVNDAGALRVAAVGIGLKGGIETTLEVAPIYLLNGMKDLRDLFQLAHNARNTARLTLAVSIIYNFIGGSLAIGGFMNPLLAAVIMPLSSISVIAIAIAGSSK